MGCPALIRASCSCLVRSCPVLIRASCSCLVRSCPVLIRASCSCLVRSCPVLIRASCSCLVRSCPVLIRASRGCPVRCSRPLGRYHPMTAKLRRLRSCSDCRPSVVHGRQECVVGTGSVHMLGLQRRWRPVLLVCRCLFCLGGAGVNSTGAAVIADMVHSGVVDYGPVVNIVNVRDVHVVHRAVVVEGPVIPISAFIADTTIEADMRAPVALIPGVAVAAPTPITGSPEKANFGNQHPRTWHPEVAFIPVSPVAGRPQITVGGAHGLRVHR